MWTIFDAHGVEWFCLYEICIIICAFRIHCINNRIAPHQAHSIEYGRFLSFGVSTVMKMIVLIVLPVHFCKMVDRTSVQFENVLIEVINDSLRYDDQSFNTRRKNIVKPPEINCKAFISKSNPCNLINNSIFAIIFSIKDSLFFFFKKKIKQEINKSLSNISPPQSNCKHKSNIRAKRWKINDTVQCASHTDAANEVNEWIKKKVICSREAFKLHAEKKKKNCSATMSNIKYLCYVAQ